MKLNSSAWPRWVSCVSAASFPLLLGWWATMKYRHYMEDDRAATAYLLLIMVCSFLAGLAARITADDRAAEQRHDELAKQVALDNERIWRLEETIRELKAASAHTD